MPFRSDPDLQLILDTALDAVIVMRSDGSLADWNKQAERMFGWMRDEVIGRNMAELIVPHRYRHAHHEGLNHYLATGEGPLLRTRVEITALGNGGEEFPVELSISPVHRGEEIVFLGFARDIRERVESDKMRVRRAREAELLFRVTSMAAETSSLEDALTLCLSSVCELLNWPLGHAFLPERPGEAKLISSSWVGDISAFPDLKKATETTSFTRGTGLPGIVWQRQDPIWISDLQQCELFVRHANAELGISAAFGFPIICAGEVVAILEFFNTVPTQEDADLLLTARSIGGQIGRVLERRSVQERQTLLMHELDHRAKNMLAVVMGIATQTAKGAPTVEHFTREYLSRLSSLSRAYSLLTAGSWQATTLDALVTEVVGPHLSHEKSELSVIGGQLKFPPQMALGMGMILHEMTTNAVKYGALRNGGTVSIFARHDGDEKRTVFLTWKESGLSALGTPNHKGFGSKMIETSARHELHGQFEVAYEPDGVRYSFQFPMPTALEDDLEYRDSGQSRRTIGDRT